MILLHINQLQVIYISFMEYLSKKNLELFCLQPKQLYHHINENKRDFMAL